MLHTKQNPDQVVREERDPIGCCGQIKKHLPYRLCGYYLQPCLENMPSTVHYNTIGNWTETARHLKHQFTSLIFTRCRESDMTALEQSIIWIAKRV